MDLDFAFIVLSLLVFVTLILPVCISAALDENLLKKKEDDCED